MQEAIVKQTYPSTTLVQLFQKLYEKKHTGEVVITLQHGYVTNVHVGADYPFKYLHQLLS